VSYHRYHDATAPDVLDLHNVDPAAPQAAGIPYIGHTELLAALTGEERGTTVLAMYHDQGHIPIKTHGFERSVTVALAHKRVV